MFDQLVAWVSHLLQIPLTWLGIAIVFSAMTETKWAIVVWFIWVFFLVLIDL